MAGPMEDHTSMMKSILNVVALCAVIALTGCNNSNKVSPGAVGDEGCCKSKASCTENKEGTSMGAVSEKKPGCCASKSGASMGAVSDGKTCPAAKSSCTGKSGS